MDQEADLTCPGCDGPKTRQAKLCATCAGAGHTSEQRDRLSTPLCGAKKRDGTRCRAFAGQGTEHTGIGKCRWHGGATRTHNTHAVNVEVKQRMAAMGDPIDVTAPEALMGMLRATAGHVEHLRTEVAALETLSAQEAQVRLSLYSAERDRLTRIAEACVRAGVAEHIVRVESAQAAMTAQAVQEAGKAIGLNRTQMSALGVALRVSLAEAAGEGEQADAARERLHTLREQIQTDDTQRIAAAAKREAERLTGLTHATGRDDPRRARRVAALPHPGRAYPAPTPRPPRRGWEDAREPTPSRGIGQATQSKRRATELQGRRGRRRSKPLENGQIAGSVGPGRYGFSRKDPRG